MDLNKFPYEWEYVDLVTSEELRRHFKGFRREFVFLGPKRYFHFKPAEQHLSKIYHMEIREDDVWIVTHPRSGTTVTQELIWKVAHDMDFDEPELSIREKFPFIESPAMIDSKLVEELMSDKPEYKEVISTMSNSVVDKVASNPSPRFLKSHLPLSLLSPKLLDTAKVVYVARDPRDVAVSCYHFFKMLKNHQYEGDFKTFWNFFYRGLIVNHPFFEHVKEAWELRNHPNMLFLFYEDVVKDTPLAIRRVALFLNKQPTEEQVAKLTAHLNIENFRRNKNINGDFVKELGILVSDENNFIRKGKVGGWRDYFDEEMTHQSEEWIKKNLKDTDLRFSGM